MSKRKEKIFKLVDKLTAGFIDDGYNRTQARSLAWAEYYESYSVSYLRAGLGGGMQFHAKCHDCNESAVFHCADTIRLFIRNHKDHKTWTRKVNG